MKSNIGRKLSGRMPAVLAAIVILACVFTACTGGFTAATGTESAIITASLSTPPSGTGKVPSDTVTPSVTPGGTERPTEEGVPEFSGSPYAAVNGNIPRFDTVTEPVSYEHYSELDSLGRCGAAEACIGRDLMPEEERGSIGQIKPSGWHTVKYDIVDGKYLYNRCHLIGWQLTGENANERNLITGTRYMNVAGMLPFENMVADYIKETGNHVLYRATPVFIGSELVARGVQMEGWSVEDNGDGICFNVFVYNCQPGIQIDYSDGSSRLAEQATASPEPGASATAAPESRDYILNTSSKKFHYPSCPSVKTISDSNKESFYGTRQELIDAGYSPCGVCKP